MFVIDIIHWYDRHNKATMCLCGADLCTNWVVSIIPEEVNCPECSRLLADLFIKKIAQENKKRKRKAKPCP